MLLSYKCLGSLLSTLFADLLPWVSLSFGCRSCLRVGSGHPTVTCFLGFGQLWISVLASPVTAVVHGLGCRVGLLIAFLPLAVCTAPCRAVRTPQGGGFQVISSSTPLKYGVVSNRLLPLPRAMAIALIVCGDSCILVVIKI